MMAQYAHIIPDKMGGEYEFNNLLFFCYDCHRKLEPMIARGELRQARIQEMQKIKNSKTIDRLAEGIFDELLATSDIVVNFGKGITVKNSLRAIQEAPVESPESAYLSITATDGLLNISGLLKDENNKPLIYFDGLYFRLYTGDFWDIIRKPGKLEIVNISRRVRLSIQQSTDLSILILGKFFIGRNRLNATKDALWVNGEKHRDCLFQDNQIGIMLQ